MQEYDARIAELRTHRVPCRREPEDLDAPVDADVRVDAGKHSHKLVLVADGQDVSWATVVSFQQRIGCATVRMGGIAGVGTSADHRFQGYSRRVLENSLRWMRCRGFDVSMLYGIPSYYPKFGYAKAFPDVTHTLAVRDAERAGARQLQAVPFQPELHLAGVLAIYHESNRQRTGTVLRSPDAWQPFRRGLSWNSKADVTVFLDSSGQVRGYIVYHVGPQTATVIEAGGSDPAVYPDLVGHAAERAWGQRLECVRFMLPADDLMMDWARHLGVRTELVCPADGGPMVRMISVRGALLSAASELGPRMCRSGVLSLQTNLDTVGITWRDGELSVGDPLPGPVAAMPQWALAQLLYGYRDARCLRAEGALDASEEAMQLLVRLFPAQPHYQYISDHF